MKRILITGGAGFIGTHLARRAIAAGHQVRILDNLSPQIHGPGVDYEPPPGTEFLRGDVTVRENMEHALQDVDTVVHLAAETGTGQSMYEIERYYRVNVGGTALLFDILANSERPSVENFVLASSRSVYGEGAYICRSCDSAGRRCFPPPRSPEQLARQEWEPHCPHCGTAVEATATREDDALSPASVYAATKLAQEELVRVACQSMGIAHAILRLQNVYGEGQSLKNPYTGILSIFSTRIRRGLPVPIFEDGNETRDFVHVEDVVEMVLACIEKPSVDGATLNVGSGRPISVMEVAKLLCRVMQSEIVPHVVGKYRIGDIRHNFADIALAERTTGLRPRVGLDCGLERFCNWVATQKLSEDMLDQANARLEARKMMG
ncbi:MAG TPA: NAD-dependent epimerase/dehydratase family protein [Sphingomicrobium sp.]|nr:NAD-dependent epimerase/dehydratase family protein [Sphingomicrobium sp.]